MKQYMPGDYGWVDKGGSQRPVPKHGSVLVKSGDEETRHDALTTKEAQEIIRWGSKVGRPLTHDEEELAKDNRAIAREDLRAMERWYRSEVASQKSRMASYMRRHPDGTIQFGHSPRNETADDYLAGVYLGDATWRSRIW